MLLRFNNIELFLNFLSENSKDLSIGIYNQFQRINRRNNKTETITVAYAKLSNDTLIVEQSNELNGNIDFLDRLLLDSNFTKLNFTFNEVSEEQIYFNVL